MRHKRWNAYIKYGLVLVLTVLQATACANTAQNAAKTNPAASQEEVTRPPSISITEASRETETVVEPETEGWVEVFTKNQELPEESVFSDASQEEPCGEETSEDEKVSEAETGPAAEKVTEKSSEQETMPTAETDGADGAGTETETEERPAEPETTAKETTSIQQVELPATQTAEYTGTITVKTASAPGTELYSGNGATIDASNKASGYIMVKYEGGGDKRVKVRVSLNGVNYDYDLNTAGSYEAYPLQMGNGSYTVIVMQNVYDNQYAVLHTATFNAEISNSLSPYLYPSQKISFSSTSKAVKKSYDLCVGLTTDEQKVTAIYNYIIQNVKYDYDKAAQVTSGTLTSYNSKADTTLENNKGICTDYATLMAVMLRAQNIPTQMIFGSETSASYHAWNKVYYNGSWVLYDATYGAGGAVGSNYTEMKRY